MSADLSTWQLELEAMQRRYKAFEPAVSAYQAGDEGILQRASKIIRQGTFLQGFMAAATGKTDLLAGFLNEARLNARQTISKPSVSASKAAFIKLSGLVLSLSCR